MKPFTPPSSSSSSRAIAKSSSGHRAVSLCVAALFAFTNLVPPVRTQSSAAVEKPSPWSADEGFVIYQDRDKTVCRDANAEEALSMPGRDTDIRLRRLNHLELELDNATAKSATSSGVERQTANVETQGLRIVLEGTDQLNANPTAVAAFRRAAAAWEAVIATPVVVRLKVDYGTSYFGTPWEPNSNTLGQTSGSAYRVPYTRLRQSLLAGASSAVEGDLYQRLPTSVVPTNLGTVSDVSVPSALAQTFGFVSSVPDDAVSSIAFNANFGFDFNPDDGVEPGKTDFHSVAVHEIGHALGFTSRAGSSEMPENVNQPLRLSVWDLFRFLPGMTLDAFNSAPRRMSSGEMHVHYAGGAELQLSTGRPDGNGGDGRQSSHWKDDVLGSRTYVGIMDPTISRSVAYQITRSDLAALDIFGYRLSGQGAPPPPPRPGNNDFASARFVGGNSGTVIGTNAFATIEAGEPNHGGVPGGASVWYAWQAPASGAVTFTTVGSDYDTTLGIYTGGGVAALNLIGGNDDVTQGDDTTSIVTFNAVAGTVYRIAVDGYAGETGSLSLNWNLAVTTPEYVATALSPNQVELKTWQAGGRTEAYVKLSFPTLGYRVASWGNVVALPGNRFGVDARVERSIGVAAQMENSTAAIYNLGPLTPGVAYAFDFRTSGTLAKSLDFVVGTSGEPNAIDDSRRFVQEHYLDFLGRQPDAPGWDFWTNQITQCGGDAACIDRQRVAVSGSFFLSDEFQVTGYYVYRLYKGAFGRRPRYREFQTGQAAVAAGIVVDNRLSPEVIDANKLAFARSFVQTPEFLARYPAGMSGAEFIDGVLLTTGITPDAAERNGLQVSYTNTAGTLADKRAYVLMRIVDGIRMIPRGVSVEQVFETRSGRLFYDKEYNPAFVQMQYFGYLRRDEDESGYQFWFDKLTLFGNYRDAEMVRSFILAAEYRARFGQP